MQSPTETQKIIQDIQKKFSYTLLEIAQKVGMTEAAISRWNNNKSVPTKKNLLKLQRLLLTEPDQSTHPSSSIQKLREIFNMPVSETDIPGMLKQLTVQIAFLQGQVFELQTDCAKVQQRLHEVEQIHPPPDAPRPHIHFRKEDRQASGGGAADEEAKKKSGQSRSKLPDSPIRRR